MQIARAFLRHYVRHVKRKPDVDAATEGSRPPSHCFVALSSLLAVKGGEGASAYAASKAGLLAFTRALSLEASTIYKKNEKLGGAPFRANVVLPGYVDTPMTSSKSSSLSWNVPHGHL